MTSPLPYMTVPVEQRAADSAHVRTLAICHYVWGGMLAAISSVFLMHVAMGLVMIFSPGVFSGPSGSNPPPAFMGWFFVGIGATFVTLGWTVGGLTIYSGRCLHKLRRRTFSLVLAGVNCLFAPFGTVLGVFTFLVLLRPSVIAMYQQQSN